MTVKRLYLAGPEVFLSNAVEIGEAKRAACLRLGFAGVFPLDAELALRGAASASRGIFEANMRAIADCDAIIANLTPFRSVSADPGTVFEVAHALAIGKSVFAYSADPAPLKLRVLEAHGKIGPTDGQGRLFAADGFAIEDFGLSDNLMIVEAVLAQGWDIVLPPGQSVLALDDLGVFEACLAQARAAFDRQAADGLAARNRI